MQKVLKNLVLSSLLQILITSSSMAVAPGDFYNTGLVDINYQDFNFYNEKSPMGSYIKKTYQENSNLRKNPNGFEKLPEGFDTIINIIHSYVLDNSKQTLLYSKTSSGKFIPERDPQRFYSGKNGVNNGKGFTFDRDELPRKIARLSFCFGIDPLIYTSLLHQESMYSKNAVSTTGASGFSQLTDVAIAEVSEQLDLLGPQHRSANSLEYLTDAINCYYGPNKKWVNMWEDNTIPAGKAAYRDSYIGSGRQWLYITKSKNWLNADPDRNLVYGIIYFKLVLNRSMNKYSYSKALRQYNIGEEDIYLKRINGFYGNIANDLAEVIQNDETDTVAGKLNKIDYKEIQFKIDDYSCSIPNNDSSWRLPGFALGLYSAEEVSMALKDEWIKSGRCQKPKKIMM